jgi:hypothetical protein
MVNKAEQTKLFCPKCKDELNTDNRIPVQFEPTAKSIPYYIIVWICKCGKHSFEDDCLTEEQLKEDSYLEQIRELRKEAIEQYEDYAKTSHPPRVTASEFYRGKANAFWEAISLYVHETNKGNEVEKQFANDTNVVTKTAEIKGIRLNANETKSFFEMIDKEPIANETCRQAIQRYLNDKDAAQPKECEHDLCKCGYPKDHKVGSDWYCPSPDQLEKSQSQIAIDKVIEALEWLTVYVHSPEKRKESVNWASMIALKEKLKELNK